MSYDKVVEALKHLPGQHDQSSHGRGKGKSGGRSKVTGEGLVPDEGSKRKLESGENLEFSKPIPKGKVPVRRYHTHVAGADVASNLFRNPEWRRDYDKITVTRQTGAAYPYHVEAFTYESKGK